MLTYITESKGGINNNPAERRGYLFYSWLTTSTLFIPVWMASMFIGIILW